MKIKLLIKIVNIVKLVFASKKLVKTLINVKRDFSKEEVDKKALALGKWQLFKEMYYGDLIHTGLFNKDVEHVLFQHLLQKLRLESGVQGVDMTGDEMLSLYGLMMSECVEAIETNTKITDKYPLPKIEE